MNQPLQRPSPWPSPFLPESEGRGRTGAEFGSDREAISFESFFRPSLAYRAMRRTREVLAFAGLAWVLVGTVSVAAGVPVEPTKNPFIGDVLLLPADQPGLKAAPGIELVQANCVLCHSLDYVSTQPPLTRAQWTAGVEKMRARFGAPITTNQIPAVVEYLVGNYGKP